jgi:lysophospholipase L1-like esterase
MTSVSAFAGPFTFTFRFTFTVAFALAFAGCGPRERAKEAPATIAHGAPRFRVVGRTASSDPRGPILAWPGTTVVASVRSTSGRVRVRFDERPGPYGTSRYQALVDGRESGASFRLVKGEQTITIADALPPGPHRIEIVKLTEASVGTTVFLGFDEAETDEAPAPKKLSIEIVGDSNTAAYGVDGDGPLCHYTPETQNFLHSYAWLVGRRLDADVVALAFSGKGILQNYDRTDAMTLGKLYPLANPMDEATIVDTKATRADAVVVFAGGNDVAQPVKSVFDPPDVHTLAQRFEELLEKIRVAHPDAPIVCVITPSIDDDDPPGYFARQRLETAVRAAILVSGDKHTYFIAPAHADASELTGCDYHPNRALQERIALDVSAALDHALYVKAHAP